MKLYKDIHKPWAPSELVINLAASDADTIAHYLVGNGNVLTAKGPAELLYKAQKGAEYINKLLHKLVKNEEKS